ncbi:uncharacterized protein LOC143183506 [Calliopsis andreniformis]|uniref:uncharacterized protein LOC143183506 n=1 Tax=Calliopsis andreniformis TaxID=337506 RepID=UPI003FCCA178
MQERKEQGTGELNQFDRLFARWQNVITSGSAHAALSHTRARTCHGFQGSTASAGTRDRTVLRVKIDGYIEGPVYESDAGSQAGGKVVISRSTKCRRLVNNRSKMKHLDTGYQPSVTRTTNIEEQVAAIVLEL